MEGIDCIPNHNLNMLSYKIIYHYVNTISSIKKMIFKIIYDIGLGTDLVAIEPPIPYYY